MVKGQSDRIKFQLREIIPYRHGRDRGFDYDDEGRNNRAEWGKVKPSQTQSNQLARLVGRLEMYSGRMEIAADF